MAKDEFVSKMNSLGFALPKWCVKPSEQLVRNFESRFSLNLPIDFRNFLVQHGGKVGNANCPFQEPTPCGSVTCIDCFYGFTSPKRHDNIIDATKLIDGAPEVIAIGDNLMGHMFWMKCSGRDIGHVYMHDHEQRFSWSDEMFHEMFPDLDPDIQGYLESRKQKTLAKKPKGYEHVYRLATSFTEFINSLQPAEQ